VSATLATPSTTRTPVGPRPTPAHLLNAPLPDLLAELGVALVTSSITDRTFCGGVAVRADGSFCVLMPPGRDPVEHDILARALIGTALGVPLLPLPEPFEITEL